MMDCIKGAAGRKVLVLHSGFLEMPGACIKCVTQHAIQNIVLIILLWQPLPHSSAANSETEATTKNLINLYVS